jgi:hypothetical protein
MNDSLKERTPIQPQDLNDCPIYKCDLSTFSLTLVQLKFNRRSIIPSGLMMIPVVIQYRFW